ncbi:hypothetical protein [Vibrio owensii]|uniref:hypothetical protein n=1 Tax=Vibrio owensii TaxID=696485 RepID=UPI0018F2418F|nr:hypothetical protein [Vibrio owensii]
MTNVLMTMEEATSAINALNEAVNSLTLPEGIRASLVDKRHTLNWHRHSVEFKSPYSSACVLFSGRFNDSDTRVFTGEIRLFLRKDNREGKKYEAMLFGRLGRAHNFKSKNLIENQEQGLDCPFVYSDTIEDLLETVDQRFSSVLERAETTIYQD